MFMFRIIVVVFVFTFNHLIDDVFCAKSVGENLQQNLQELKTSSGNLKGQLTNISSKLNELNDNLDYSKKVAGLEAKIDGILEAAKKYEKALTKFKNKPANLSEKTKIGLVSFIYEAFGLDESTLSSIEKFKKTCLARFKEIHPDKIQSMKNDPLHTKVTEASQVYNPVYKEINDVNFGLEGILGTIKKQQEWANQLYEQVLQEQKEKEAHEQGMAALKAQFDLMEKIETLKDDIAKLKSNKSLTPAETIQLQSKEKELKDLEIKLKSIEAENKKIKEQQDEQKQNKPLQQIGELKEAMQKKKEELVVLEKELEKPAGNDQLAQLQHQVNILARDKVLLAMQTQEDDIATQEDLYIFSSLSQITKSQVETDKDKLISWIKKLIEEKNTELKAVTKEYEGIDAERKALAAKGKHAEANKKEAKWKYLDSKKKRLEARIQKLTSNLATTNK